MTLKSDEKFQEKLSCDFKYDMRNLVSFNPLNHSKVQKFYFDKLFYRIHLSWHWIVMHNLNKPWPCGFKNGIRNWVNYHKITQKSEKLCIDALFLSKAYTVMFHLEYAREIMCHDTEGLHKIWKKTDLWLQKW